jgi:predicted dehydrogenase
VRTSADSRVRRIEEAHNLFKIQEDFMIEGSREGPGGATLRYGMVGGGPGSFIADAHRKAIAFDSSAEPAAGVFSRSWEKTLETGRILGLDESRLYRSFDEMAKAEAEREDGIDFVVIVTPNASHYPAAKAFLERGINVVSDKPLTVEPEEAEELVRIAKEKDLLFGVTYVYTGYPMVKHAREMIRRGEIGTVRFVQAEYPQDWLATPIEQSGENRQASWRTDPAQSGKSCCVGDIGSHIENLAAYITGLRVTGVCARLDTFVEGRLLDDNASIMVSYDSGAKGLYWSSQIAIGHDNALSIRVIGTSGSIEWRQEEPDCLRVARLGKPVEILTRGRDALHSHAARYPRLPSGHPEGYYEAFANFYRTYCAALAGKKAGKSLPKDDLDFPSAEDGLSGVRFINACVRSSKEGAVWVKL